MNFLDISKKINTPYLRFEKIQINSFYNAVSIKLPSALFRKGSYRLVLADKYSTSIEERQLLIEK